MELNKIRLGVITPDRGDRPLFLAQWRRLMSNQTLQPEVIELVDYEPKSDSKDITERYKFGYDKLRGKGLDIIAFIENDDYYAPNYLETMVNAWIDHGKPDMIGTSYTIYCHLKLRRSVYLEHENRSSMMSTLMKPDLNIEWPADDYPYADSWLWMHCKNRVTFRPKELICLGMKHGQGLVGGGFHTTDLRKFTSKSILLEKILSKEDFEFYDGLF